MNCSNQDLCIIISYICLFFFKCTKGDIFNIVFWDVYVHIYRQRTKMDIFWSVGESSTESSNQVGLDFDILFLLSDDAASREGD